MVTEIQGTPAVAPDGAGTPVVLIVSSWYPSVDGLSSGRFVADQAAAIAADLRFRPVVASFDPLALWGGPALRRREADAVRLLARRGLAASPTRAFAQPTWAGPSAVPVARLSVPANAGVPEEFVADRAASLAAAADAIDSVAGVPVLVHAHTGYPDGAAAAEEAARRGVPLVITEHLSTLGAIAADPVRRRDYRRAVTSATLVIPVSEMLGREIVRLVPEAAGRLLVIPNGVDVAAYAAGDPGSRRPDELLYVGSRARYKGIGELLEAVAQARMTRPGIRLRLVGRAPAALDNAWRSRTEALGLAGAVDLEPETDRAGVAAAMARASLFVHPSPRETFGVVAAEALAAGLPVVAVDSGGVSEVLGPEPANNGALVPAGDPGRLAGAILDVLARLDEYPPDALRRGAAGRFGAAVVASRVVDAYRSILAMPLATEAGRADRVRPRRLDHGADERPARAAEDVDIPMRPVVVGLDRLRAARIASGLSAASRARLVLVTSDGSEPLPAGVGEVREVSGFGARHAALRAVADATVTARTRNRRALLAHPAVLLRELLERTPWREGGLLARATAAVDAVAEGGGHVVALDGFDALAARAAVGDGRLLPLPGSGRWLADIGASAAPSDDDVAGRAEA